MSNDNHHSAKHDKILKKQSLEQSEVKEVLQIIKKYVFPAAVVIIVVCGIFLFDRYLKSSKTSKEVKADAALIRALSDNDLQEIVDKYGTTAAAPVAMMNLALSKFSAGDYDAAIDLYGRFLKKYGKNEMAAQAELNQITCREAKGELNEAHGLYGKFASSHEGSYLAPVAMMGQARCLEEMGNAAEAKQAYEDLIVAYPESSWANLAQTKAKILSSQPQ